MTDKTRKRIGYAMLAAPFVAIAIAGAMMIGPVQIAIVFGASFAVLMWIKIGVELSA